MWTPLCRILGIRVPIVQAPIGSAATPELAAAVSNAGGLGMLALSWHSIHGVAEAVHAALGLTTRPFGVNLVLEWDQRERLAVALDSGARLISLFWGDPEPYVERVHRCGGLVTHTVGSSEEARRAVGAGVDVIVAQGWEAGGHVRGGVATLPLLTAVLDAADGLPVIAAGGIADGRGIAAVLAAGAAGAWIGTRFLVAAESAAHPVYKRRLVAAQENDTCLAELFDFGWPSAPHRFLRNATSDRWEWAGKPTAGSRPGEGEVVARRGIDYSPVLRYSDAIPTTAMVGDLDELALYAGQGVAMVREELPAAEIVDTLLREAEEALARVTSWGREPG